MRTPPGLLEASCPGRRGISRDDLLTVAYVAQQAFEYILDQNDEPEPDSE